MCKISFIFDVNSILEHKSQLFALQEVFPEQTYEIFTMTAEKSINLSKKAFDFLPRTSKRIALTLVKKGSAKFIRCLVDGKEMQVLKKNDPN